MNLRGLILCVCLLATTVAWAGAQEGQPRSSEQTEFTAEAAGVDHPIPVSVDILKALEQDEMVRTEMEDSDPPVHAVPSSWFSAASVHLADQTKDDVVVLAEGQLRGANVIMFWVFRKTAQGYELVLRAPAHDLMLRKSRSHGYRDIFMQAATATQVHTVLYGFNGTHYEVKSDNWEPIR